MHHLKTAACPLVCLSDFKKIIEENTENVEENEWEKMRKKRAGGRNHLRVT
jgi:hypothetical protein